jgi:hypothetical protein
MIMRDRGHQKLIVLSDCLPVIQRIQSLKMDRSAVETVVGDIKSLTSDISTVVLRHAGHKMNVATHVLARCSESYLCNFLILFCESLSGKNYVLMCFNQ